MTEEDRHDSPIRALGRAAAYGLRFRRTHRGLRYEVTVDDPHTFTRPWTAALNLAPGTGLFEYACHEGNYAMRNMLSASRAAEAGAGPR